jgi:hypothetical protein
MRALPLPTPRTPLPTPLLRNRLLRRSKRLL